MDDMAGVTRKSGKPGLWAMGLAGALILGACFRLIWATDIEFKADEAWTFGRIQQFGHTEPFSWFGMPSSVKVPNPGMSVWIFAALAKVFGVRDPVDLARAVQLLNVAALMFLTIFALRAPPKAEREVWLWATALAALNPLAVLFQRKIWPPSVFPIFTVMYLFGWWNRHHRGGALLWGLSGACLGQIQMAGFFFAAGFVAWAWLFDRRRVAWCWWLGGSCLGIIPLLPWLRYVVTQPGHDSISLSWTRWFEFKFWSHWVTEPLGLGLRYALGPDFTDFIRLPILGGQPSYLVGLLHLLVIGIGCLIAYRAVLQIWKDGQNWQELLIGTRSQTLFTANAALWGYGILFSAVGLRFYRHYLLVAFPLTFVWLASLALLTNERRTLREARALLLTLCVLESLISAAFLYYIHVNQGTSHGDYGVAYGAQFHVNTPVRGN